eukprot:m.29712 g.29712  ORF g.29712 m.29712 type:complete len:343 (+) comp11968_c0_seq1:2073-3101(+)
MSIEEKLFDAIGEGKTAIVRKALAAYPHLVAARDYMGATPLHAAAVGGHTDIVRALLEAGANVNSTADKADFRTGEVPLHQAAKSGHAEVVELLLGKSSIKVDCQDAKKQTALLLASYRGSVEVVRLLLKANASHTLTDTNGITPMHAACRRDHRGVVLALLKAKASPYTLDVKGDSPMVYAARHNAEKALYAFAESGVRVKQDRLGKSILSVAQEANQPKSIAAIQLLWPTVSSTSKRSRHNSASTKSPPPVIEQTVDEADEFGFGGDGEEEEFGEGFGDFEGLEEELKPAESEENFGKFMDEDDDAGGWAPNPEASKLVRRRSFFGGSRRGSSSSRHFED